MCGGGGSASRARVYVNARFVESEIAFKQTAQSSCARHITTLVNTFIVWRCRTLADTLRGPRDKHLPYIYIYSFACRSADGRCAARRDLMQCVQIEWTTARCWEYTQKKRLGNKKMHACECRRLLGAKGIKWNCVYFMGNRFYEWAPKGGGGAAKMHRTHRAFAHKCWHRTYVYESCLWGELSILIQLSDIIHTHTQTLTHLRCNCALFYIFPRARTIDSAYICKTEHINIPFNFYTRFAFNYTNSNPAMLARY